MKHPNLIIVFADQMRYQATGYAGDPNVRTPRLDRLAAESLHFTTAVSGCPVCSPARASLLTGRYPDKHGVFVNDAYLDDSAVSLAEACRSRGYETAYIGKWHLDGHGARSAYIPPERRQGFDFWEVLECTHDYHHSPYYAGDDPTKRYWEGYDAAAQTRHAQRYIRVHAGKGPFLLVLSWGPPHDPYGTAPEEYLRLYDPGRIALRPNVPPAVAEQARADLAGYYAHISALDALTGDLLDTLDEVGIAQDTLFVFWSDHGDMLGSQGVWRKQHPYDESILVPLLVRYPAGFGRVGRRIAAPINTPDLMPTLLDLCDVPIPETVDGQSYAPFLKGESPAPAEAVLIACYHPFGEYSRLFHGGREYRGVRTRRHTYVRDLSGPWLLFDNARDPYQMRNLVHDPAHADWRTTLDDELNRLLEKLGDEFLPAKEYLRRWGYVTRPNGAMYYTP